MIDIIEQLENLIRSTIYKANLTPQLQEASLYMLFPGGKRIRPKFLLGLTTDLLGKGEAARPACAALELFHTATLIHDDLPEMDNDDFRRGVPTCHKKFSAAIALLSGDVLPFIGLRAYLEHEKDLARALKVSGILTMSFIEVGKGQELDLDVEARRTQLETIHRLKSGSLFEAAAKISAIYSDLPDLLVEECGEFGAYLGIAFQMADDFLDRFGDSTVTGRFESSDARNNKVTLFNPMTKNEGADAISALKDGVNSQINLLETRVQFETGRAVSLVKTRDIVSSIFERTR